MRHTCDNGRAFADCTKEARRLERLAEKLARGGCIESAEAASLSAVEHRRAAARYSLSLFVCGCRDNNPPR